MFRPQADRDGLAGVRVVAPRRQAQPRAATQYDRAMRSVLVDPARDQIHGRGAHEAGHEKAGRRVVHVLWRAYLFDPPAVHQHDAVGQSHGFDLVMGDVDRGGAHAFAQLLDFGAHLHTQLGVQVGQRLVEQKHLGFPHDGAAHGHALALPAGQLARLALQQGHDVQDARRFRHPARDFALGHAAVLQRERDVLEHRQVRVQRVVLEHHGHVAVLGVYLVHHPPADGDLSARDVLQPGDHAQQGALAAARRADQHHELVVGHFQIDAVHDLLRVVCFAHLAQAYGCHVVSRAVFTMAGAGRCSC